MFDNFVNRLNDSSNIEVLTKARQIYLLNNDISCLNKSEKNLNEEKNFLKNRSQEH